MGSEQPMSSPFGDSQSSVSSPSSDQTTPSPATAAIERLRSTLPTEQAAQPAHEPAHKHRHLHFPNISSPRPSSKAKRSTGVLTLLRKPKPKWDDLKEKLRNRHRPRTSEASEGNSSVSEQTEDFGEDENGHNSLQEEGSRLESQESMMPDVLRPGQDLHVQVVSAKGLRAADTNGLSDPYAVVHLGDRTQQTRVIQENLNPEWHETFVFSAEDIQSALMDSMSSLLFEVWDSDFGLVADDFLGQAEFSILDFKATEEPTKVQLPLYIELKGKRIDTGCGTLTVVLWLTDRDADGAAEGEDAPSIVSTVCPTAGPVPKQLPSLVHDDKGNTLYEEPSIAWMHIRIAQVAMVKHQREEDGLRALARIFTGSKSESKRKRWSLGRSSRKSSFSSEPELRETLKPSPSFKERRNLRRVISDDKENSSSKDDRGKLKTVKRKVKHLFGKADKEEENQAADFVEDDTQDAFDEEDDDEAEQKEQDQEGTDDKELDREQLLYWEVSVGSQQHRSRLAPLAASGIAKWQQDFAFAVVLPLKTRPLVLELHESKGGRRKGRTLARAYIPLADLFPTGKSEFGSDVEWFKLHDVDRRSSGEIEAAVCLAAACVDIDKRRAMYALPLAVAPEKRVTRGQLEKISAQQSEASFSSQQRPRETAEVSAEPEEEKDPPAEPQTFKEKFLDKLKGMSIMPSPERALETCQEDTGGELAAAESRGLKDNGSGLGDSSTSAQQPSQAGASSQRAAGPDIAHEEQQPLLSHGSTHGATAEAADKERDAGSGGAEQALQEEQARVDAEGGEGGGAGRAAAEPLSWGTRLAQKLFIQKPKWDKPAPPPPQALGMVQLLIKEAEMETSEACFLLLHCGAQWGRSVTLPSSKTHNFNWEVHMPILEPSTLLQLALFKETGPRGSKKSVLVGLLRLRLNSLTSEVDHSAELPMCSSRKQGGEKTATIGLNVKVSYFSKRRLLRTYILPAAPLGIYKHGLNKGDVKHALERETNCIIMRWLETSNPPVARAVAETLIRSPQDSFAMSRVKANWRRVAVWFDGFKKAGEGWKYLQSWENPGATIGTMAGLTSICCYPHVTISLALTGLVLFMVLAYPKQDVGKPRPMEPDPDAEDDEDDEDNELQGTMVTRLQRRVDGMQKIALKVQNVLDDVASALERCNGLICWADPNASAFFLLIATSWALLIAVLGLHTVLSALLCWMLRPPFLRVAKPPPPVSFIGRLPTKADQIT